MTSSHKWQTYKLGKKQSTSRAVKYWNPTNKTYGTQKLNPNTQKLKKLIPT